VNVVNQSLPKKGVDFNNHFESFSITKCPTKHMKNCGFLILECQMNCTFLIQWCQIERIFDTRVLEEKQNVKKKCC
jgi:hypothetical protein